MNVRFILQGFLIIFQSACMFTCTSFTETFILLLLLDPLYGNTDKQVLYKKTDEWLLRGIWYCFQLELE